MAVTGGYQPKKYNYTPLQNNAPAGQQADVSPQQARGVSDQTRAQQARYQNGYNPSENVTDAQARLQQVINQKPQGYTSKYGAALDGILQEIQNPEKFNYSFNNDEMFKYYADLYTQKGRQASADAMGQAAGLTGGYGNSYAQQAGNQAYQQYLLGLYDKGSEFRNQARQEFEADRADRYNRLGALQQADQSDYARYRDEVGDWETERGYYTDRADTEYNRDYDAYIRDRDYWNQQAQQENADWWQSMQYNEQMRQNDASRQMQYDQMNTENQYRYDTLEEQQNQFGANYAQQLREFEESVRQYDQNYAEQVRQFNETSRLDWAKLEENQRQFDANLSEEQRQYNRNLAYNYVQAILAKNQIPSNELLVAAGLSQADAQKMITEIVAGGGGGGGGSTSRGSGNGTNKKTTTSTGNTSTNSALNGLSFYEANLIENASKVAAAAGASGAAAALPSANKLINDYANTSVTERMKTKLGIR